MIAHSAAPALTVKVEAASMTLVALASVRTFGLATVSVLLVISNAPLSCELAPIVIAHAPPKRLTFPAITAGSSAPVVRFVLS